MAEIQIQDVAMAAIDVDQLAGAWIEQPCGRARLDGHEVAIDGWVVGREAAAMAVELVYDRVVVGRAPIGLPRADPARNLAGFPGAEHCGFHVRASVLGGAGELELGIRAVLQNQCRVTLGSVRVRRGWRTGPGERVGAALVSVVIPSYNQARFLGEAIESICMQTYPHIEVVVVDDGSSDNTEEVAMHYPGVRLIRQENLGLAAARNTGLRRTCGSYVVFLDADDRLLPGAVEAGLNTLRTHREWAMAVGQWRFVALNWSPLPTHTDHGVEGDPYVALLSGRWWPAVHAVMHRREALEDVGGFDQTLNAHEDHDLYLRLTRQYPVGCHDALVAEYRRHASNMSRDRARMASSKMAALRKQWEFASRDTERTTAYREGMTKALRAYRNEVVAENRARVLAGEGTTKQELGSRRSRTADVELARTVSPDCESLTSSAGRGPESDLAPVVEREREEVPRRVALSLNGPVRLTSPVLGVWPDNWVGSELRFRCIAEESVHAVVVEGWLPEPQIELMPLELTIGQINASHVVGSGIFRWEVSCALGPGVEVRVVLTAGRTFSPATDGTSGDCRQLAFVLSRLTFEPAIAEAPSVNHGQADSATSAGEEPERPEPSTVEIECSADARDPAVGHDDTIHEPAAADHRLNDGLVGPCGNGRTPPAHSFQSRLWLRPGAAG